MSSLFRSRSNAELGIIFALSIESGRLVDRLKAVRVTRGDGFTVREGTLSERHILIVESGPGAACAIKATNALIDTHRPRLIVSSGFAGGLDAALHRLDLIVPTSIVDAEGNEIAVDASVVPNWLNDFNDLHRGRLLTMNRIVRLPSEKQQLGCRLRAVAVDMESHAVAAVCRNRQTPFLAVRAISDAATDELPPDIGKLLSQTSFAGQFGAALGSIFRRPAAVKDMFQLHQSALAASERLAQFLEKLIERQNIDASI